MTCLLLNDKGICIVTESVPDIYVSEVDFGRILRDVKLRNELYAELISLGVITDSSILIGSLGEKDTDSDIYRDYKVTATMNLENADKRGLGIYERF